LPGSDKGNENYVRAYCEAKKLNNVLFPGFVNDKVLNALYKNAIAMVMPTLLGPTNMPILEAMALGCPVICSDLKGHFELTQNKNQLFAPLNSSALSSLLHDLHFNNSFREEIISKQYDTYRSSKFNKNSTVDYLITNLKEAM